MTQHFGLTDSLTTMTPTVRNFRDGVLLPQLARYRELIGELVYLTIVGPDVAHVVHILSQFVTSLASIHCTTLL